MGERTGKQMTEILKGGMKMVHALKWPIDECKYHMCLMIWQITCMSTPYPLVVEYRQTLLGMLEFYSLPRCAAHSTIQENLPGFHQFLVSMHGWSKPCLWYVFYHVTHVRFDPKPPSAAERRAEEVGIAAFERIRTVRCCFVTNTPLGEGFGPWYA